MTHKTRPLQPGGALMLGAEQDCYGGCTDRQAGLAGLAGREGVEEAGSGQGERAAVAPWKPCSHWEQGARRSAAVRGVCPFVSRCRGQGYHGQMDEVRVWRTARTQAEILRHMRDASGLDNHSVSFLPAVLLS